MIENYRIEKLMNKFRILLQNNNLDLQILYELKGENAIKIEIISDDLDIFTVLEKILENFI